MLTEILIYIVLFATLFSSAFMSAFQTVDAVRYLQEKKSEVDSLYFLQSRLDSLVASTSNWNNLSGNIITQSVSGGELRVDFLSSQIIETATSSSRVLLLKLDINNEPYTFSYVQEK